MNRLKALEIEDFIWIILIGIILLSFYANNIERCFLITGSEYQKEKYRQLLIFIFTVVTLVYLYYANESKKEYQKLKTTDTTKKKVNTTLSYLASILILCAGLIYIYISITDTELDIELAYNKRILITSAISIILVSILYIGNTYSVFTTTSPDEEVNTYKTGNLDIEVIENNTTISNISPIKTEDSNKLEPYRITVKNKGTTAYQFNVVLDETTSSDSINHKYIMTKVGKLEPINLAETENNIIKENIILLPDEEVSIDIRVWISDRITNSEMNKSFFAKIKIDGSATQTKNRKTDNSSLMNPKEEIKEQEKITEQKDLQDQTQQSDNTKIEELPQ